MNSNTTSNGENDEKWAIFIQFLLFLNSLRLFRRENNVFCQTTIILIIYCLKVLSHCICSRVSLVSLLLYIAAPPTFYQIFMNNGLFQKTKVEFHD